MKNRTFSRIISCILVLIMLIGIVPALNASAAAADTAETAGSSEYNTYKKFQESITPENNYGLADTVNEGKILQAWNWSYENTIARMEQVAKQGFTTIQVSPPNEIKMPTKGVKVCEPAVDGVSPNGWWMFYHPAGFQLNESEDNALGTKTQFVEMCEEAKKYGIKIIVDTVVNHMGTDDDHIGVYNNDSIDPMDHVNPRAAEFEPELLAAKAFHSPWKECAYIENYWNGLSDFDIEESLTQHAISGFPDLATETQLVQDTIYDYLVELVEAGADGFRFDAAKHIETSHDTYFPSDFWEDTLLKVRDNYPDKEIFAYSEILNKCGDGRPFSEYTELMDVTDSSSFWGIKDAVINGGGNPLPKYPNTNFTKENVIQWNESHDTYIDGSTSYFTIEQRNKIWALTAARESITGVYFARPDDRTGYNRAAIESICSEITLGDANVTAWARPEVAAVNRFDNFFGDAAEYTTKQNGFAVIERGGVGATLVSFSAATGVKVSTYSLADGRYVDAITGNEFTITDGKLTGTVGSTGIACIYYAENREPVIPPYPIDVNDIDVSNGQYPVFKGYNTVVFSTMWDNPHFHAWNYNGDIMADWPGTPMKYALLNEYGEKQYVAYIPTMYDYFILNDGGNGQQTIDLEINTHIGAYLKDKDSEGKYTIGTWQPYFYDYATLKPIEPPTPDEVPTEPTTPTEPKPTVPEEPTGFTVVFIDYDGKFIDAQFVKKGQAAVPPKDPTRGGYTFIGWDKDFSNVTSALVVTAKYERKAMNPEEIPTTGALKIEIAGGRGFSISINGGVYKPQGASYVNSQVPIGATVSLKANALADVTFEGWINPLTSIIISSDYEYTFTATGNDYVKAMYTVPVDGAQMVTFKNDRQNRILDSQYYSTVDEIQFPKAPTQVGFDFAGWSMTEAEIISDIAQGKNVTVVAEWTKRVVPVKVTVNGGKGTGTYNANTAVTVTADEPEAGQKFAYWKDAKGNIKSYNVEYKFYPIANTTLTAVFVDEDTVIDYQILASVDSIDTTTIADKNVFYFSWYCPQGYTFVKSGILAVNKDYYNEETFVAGTSDSNVYDRSPSGTNKPDGSVSWTKSSVTDGQTWVACAYVQYKDAKGSVITVYSELREATKGEDPEPEPEPTPDPGPTFRYEIKGTFDDWGYGYKLFDNGDGTASATLKLAPGRYEFKLYETATAKWLSNSTEITDITGVAWTFRESVETNVVMNASGGTYTFTLTTGIENGEYKVKLSITAELDPVADLYEIKGSFNNWGSGYKFVDNGDGSASAVIKLAAGEYEFKLYETATSKWLSNVNDFTDITGVPWTFRDTVGSSVIMNASGGTYTFTLTAGMDNGEYKVKLLVTAELTRSESGWSVIGDAAVAKDLLEEEEISEGVYSYTLTLEAGTYKFKIQDATGETPVVYGTRATATDATPTEGVNFVANNKDYQYTFTATGGKYTFTVDTTAVLPTGAPAPKVIIASEMISRTTVYFINSGYWSTVNAHVWSTGGSPEAEWPGFAMTKTYQKINGFDVYSYTFNAKYDNIIFNNGSGTQTDNLTVNAGKYFYYNNLRWYSSASDVPEPKDTIKVYFLEPSNWEDVYIYLMDVNTNQFGAVYPGTRMTYVGYNYVYGGYLYSAEISAEVGLVKFADGSATNRRTTNSTASQVVDGAVFGIGTLAKTNQWNIKVLGNYYN